MLLKRYIKVGFLTTFDERMLPHPREIDQNFCSLVKSPPLARTPPPTGFTLIGALNTDRMPRVQSFSVLCFPTGETHITSDMCFPSDMAASDMC